MPLRSPRFLLLSVALLVVALPAASAPGEQDEAGLALARARSAARHRPSRLVEGGFVRPGAGAPAPSFVAPPRLAPEPPALLLDRLLQAGALMPLPGGRFALGAASPAPDASPHPLAVGDKLVVSVDDDIDLPVLRAWEGRLDVSGGLAAGPTDAVAVRFRSQALATSPPFRVSAVRLGLDNLNGATTWPSIEAWVEDASAPLQPRQGSLSATASLDAVAAGLVPAPARASRPTDMQRLPVRLALDVPDTWLSDGAFDDDFARADGPLDDGLSDWLECQDGQCLGLPGPPSLRIASTQVTRATSGASILAVKFPEFGVEQVRPAGDLDLWARVTVRDGDANFSRAGLAMRALAGDTHYRVEYVKATASVEVAAVVAGAVTVLDTFPAGGPGSGSRVLEVLATGGTDQVRLAVTLDGTLLGTSRDATFRLIGGLVGLSASDAASRGEVWDDFVVERRPDLFAVIGLPPGEDAGLPLDLSLDSVRSDSILLSSDGVAFTPRATGAGCAQPGNPFVQLEVEDTISGTALFEREAHLVEVAVACPTCPPAVNTCTENRSFIEASPDSLMAGHEMIVTAGWWNEHLGDDAVAFTTSLFDAPCDFLTTPLQAVATWVGADAGQASDGPALRRAEVARFTPGLPGEYCVVVLEQHDSNGDCCPDGAEMMPLGGCPGTCTPVPPSDSNPSTVVALRDVRVLPDCVPRTQDAGRDGPDDLDGDTIPDEVNLDGASLRVAKADGQPDAVSLSWGVVDPLVFPARYNLLLMQAGALPDGDCFRVVAPVFEQPSGTLARTVDMPMREEGCLWFALFETDGCGGDASVADASADDPALRCP